MLSSYATITPYNFLPSLRRISSATVAYAQTHMAAASRADRAGSFIAKVSRWPLHGARGVEFEFTRKLTFEKTGVWRPHLQAVAAAVRLLELTYKSETLTENNPPAVNSKAWTAT